MSRMFERQDRRTFNLKPVIGILKKKKEKNVRKELKQNWALPKKIKILIFPI